MKANLIFRMLNVIAFLAAMPNGQVYGQRYCLADLGTLGGGTSMANAINNSGQVAGQADTSSGTYHAFLYSNGLMRDLGTLGGKNSVAFGINSIGQVVGYAETSGPQWHAFLYSNGLMSGLGTWGGDNSQALGINNNGQVVGFAFGYSAFLYSNGSGYNLGTLFSDKNQESVARGINASGEIVGSYASMGPNFFQHAFLYSNGSMHDLGSFGGKWTVATGINDNGQIVGYSYSNGLENGGEAFLYSDGLMSGLGTLGYVASWALGINNNGQVVGYVVTSKPTVSWPKHAIIYSNGLMEDLNNLVVMPTPGWTLQQANAINDNGQIVGYGINPSGKTHAFLLDPLPVGTLQAIQKQPTIKTYANLSDKRFEGNRAYRNCSRMVFYG